MDCNKQTVVYLVVLMSSVTVLWTIYQTQFTGWPGKPTVRYLSSTKKSLPPPCGSVCTYDGEYHPQKPYPYITKPIDCANIMKRMAWTGHTIVNPPPKQPPPADIKKFTQNGECPFGKPYYLDAVKPSKTMAKGYSKQFVLDMITKDKNGEHINSYKHGWIVSKTVKQHNRFVKGKKGFVMGTERPWVEAVMLSNGASHVTTIEYREFAYGHPNMSLMNPYKFAEKYVHGRTDLFDFGASYSSLEHSGLGRYGDPLNPFGDMEAMAQAFCMTKPGGVYFLGVPYSKNCTVVWNAHRIYSPVRLQHLTANWELLDMVYGGNLLVVLKKPEL